MTYSLRFHELAIKEWQALPEAIKGQLKKKLKERLENPRVPASALRGLKDGYKIKLASAGYRLVYQVRDSTITVVVIAIGRRDKNAVYSAAETRFRNLD